MFLAAEWALLLTTVAVDALIHFMTSRDKASAVPAVDAIVPSTTASLTGRLP